MGWWSRRAACRSTPSRISPIRRSSCSPSGWAAAPTWSRIRSPIRSSRRCSRAPKVDRRARLARCSACRFVYVLFEEGTDVYWARSRVLEYLSAIRGAPARGRDAALGPDATGVGWVFQYALVDKSGQARPRRAPHASRTSHLRYALESVPGVAEVATRRRLRAAVPGHGRSRPAARVRPVARRRQRTRSAQSNADVGGRVLEMSGREYFVRGRGYVQDLGDLESDRRRGAGPRRARRSSSRDVGQRALRARSIRRGARRAGTARARPSAASSSCATARTRSTSSSA